MSTANCRPTARRPSPPGLRRIRNEAALVAAWRAQADSIRARYGAVVNEPVPERLKLDQVMRQDRASGRSWAAMAAAAAVVAFLAGGAAGWVARGAATGVAEQL